ncbi:MAG TPA: phosphomannomutase/phosphoglucomutase [Candidatus Avanaerovorax faecigallinarum]|nr:phosphomannomutase/phosphoglucomutase [Candidatus Avanaerovorax faecigallinarum]
MIEYNFGALQNGSDIRGVAMEVPGGKPVNLGDVATARLAKGFLFWLSNKTGKKPSEITVSIGRDSRVTGPELEAAFAYALIPYGVTVLRAGLASTPAMFMSTVFDQCRCDGAVMITASHLPKERNGFKFFDADGGLNKGDITDIITFAESDSILGRLMPVNPGSIEDSNLMELYCAHLRKLITDGVGSGETPLSGLKITVDAGNGGGGFYARNVLEPLGADVSSSQFLEPDGEFPNHAPNPEDKAAMASICSRVKEAGSDLGLIFDTDVDRASAVDENGCEINRNKIVALAAALIENPSADTTVVTDSITSGHLKDFLESTLNLKHLRFRRGYRNVINKAIELREEGIDARLAIETSGHAAYEENYFLDDGAYLATKIVIKTALLHREGNGISSLIADMAEPAESREIRFPILTDDFSSYADGVLAAFEEAGNSIDGCSLASPNYEGIRLEFTSPEIAGWLLIRKSLHDPIMPLNLESDVSGGVDKMLALIKPVLDRFEKLDKSVL